MREAQVASIPQLTSDGGQHAEHTAYLWEWVHCAEGQGWLPTASLLFSAGQGESMPRWNSRAGLERRAATAIGEAPSAGRARPCRCAEPLPGHQEYGYTHYCSVLCPGPDRASRPG
jgi:hypothetical protein